jgi:hypothetical protein
MPVIPLKRCKDTIFSKNFAKKVVGIEKMCTFAIPNDSDNV